MTVGIVGLGAMGSAIAGALLPHHPLVVRDIDPIAAQRQAAAGATVAGSLAEVAAQAEIVLLSMPGPDEVSAVVGDLLATPAGPAVIVDLSTVDPDTTRDLAGAAARRAVGYLDAPVLGRPHRCGAWTLPVGGDAAVLDRARPVLELLASRLIHVGGPGAGNVVKLLNNLMLGAINAITAETMAAAGRLGLDPQTYSTALAESGAASVSNLFREIAPKIVEAEFSPAFTVDLLAKDNRLGLAMLERAGLDPPVTRAVVAVNESGQAAGLGGLDTSALVKLFQEGHDGH